MKARALVIGAVLAAGCGLTAVGTHVDPTAADAGPASVNDALDGSTDAMAVPGAGSSEVPISDLDAGTDTEGDADTDASTAPPPFEIVARPGGKSRIFPPGTLTPCSVTGGQAASFTLKNLGTETVRVRWVDYGCIEEDYGTVSPGNAKTQPTYVGHRWRIRSNVDGSLRGDFVLDAPGTYQVVVR